MDGLTVWFEIPVKDIARAQKFYETIFDFEMYASEVSGQPMAFFPMEDGDEGAPGALIAGDGFEPSKTGVQVYLGCGDDLSDVLSRVEAAGGKVTQPKTVITEEYGYMAYFNDTEGNQIGLWSRN